MNTEAIVAQLRAARAAATVDEAGATRDKDVISAAVAAYTRAALEATDALISTGCMPAAESNREAADCAAKGVKHILWYAGMKGRAMWVTIRFHHRAAAEHLACQ